MLRISFISSSPAGRHPPPHPTLTLTPDPTSLRLRLQPPDGSVKGHTERKQGISETGSEPGMGRKPCCEKVGLKRGPWTAEEDQKLVSYITNSGLGCWRAIPKLAGLLRCGKSCRLRWTNYLRPDLKRGIFSEAEENLILDLHATLGNRWSRIAAQLPGRTDNEIKNYWNTRLKKRLRSQGLDPATHLPLDSSKQADGTGDDTDSPDGEDGDSSDASGTKSETRQEKKAAKPQEPAKPVRQPRGPKPAPQLKMCQSEEGLVLLRVPKSPKSPTSVINPGPAGCKCDDDQHSELSSSSTVTTKSTEDHQESTLARKLTSAPSFPEAELWKCIKPSTTSSPLSSATMLDEWDSHRHVDPSLLNSYPGQPNTMLPKVGDLHCTKPSITSSPQGMLESAGMQQDAMMHFNSHPPAHDYVGENYGSIFQGTCFPQAEIGMSWSMDVEMGQPPPESLFAPNSIPMNPAVFYREVHQPVSHPSQELQRLAALLDLI